MAPAEIRCLPLATTRQWRGEWAAWFSALGVPAGPSEGQIEHDRRALTFDAALSGNAVCLAMKLDQDADLAVRTSFKTDRAMKSADRRGAM